MFSLSIGGDTVVREPDADTVEKYIGLIQTREQRSDPFLILENESDGRFMQTYYIHEQNQFVLEYQNGDLDRHYKCNDLVMVETVARAFTSFVAADDLWKQQVPWVRVQL